VIALFDRLRQRKIVQWALAYVAAAFALIQGADLVAQRFDWPEQTIRLLIIASAAGFLITLVLAWYHGERGAQRVTAVELAIVSVIVIAGGVAIWRFAIEPSSSSAKLPRAPADAKSIAVLPFDNLSEEKANAYFASGMQDMILTKLAGVGDLRVISRTSTEKYKSHPENLAAIGKDLGVATILEGSVQKSGNRVLINLQLIDVSNDSHLWAKDYTRTIDDMFGVEGEVAENVAEALRVALTHDERTALAAKPTQNAEALEAYLQGLSLQAAPGFGGEHARDSFEKAVALDPDFTLAWTELVWERVRWYWFGFDVTPENLEAAKAALDRATSLAPDLPQVQRARAQYLYFVQRDFERASALMEQVQRGLPNDMRTWFFSALVDRRVGRWEDAVGNLRKAALLAPTNDGIALELARTAMLRRHFDEARKIIDATPENPSSDADREFAFFAALNLGGVEAGGAYVATLASNGKATPGLTAWHAMLERRFNEASSLYGKAIEQAAADPQYQAEYVIPFLQTTVSWQLDQAFCEQRDGALDIAKTHYSAIRKRAQEALDAKPANPSIEAAWHVALALADAGSGDRENAVIEAQRAVDLIPESSDRLLGPAWQDYLARIYATNGDAARAVPLIRHLVTTNGSNTTRAMLDIDPVWDPIRADEEFRRMLRDVR
jgi:TolB-like protein/Tfp pilus assembly protein PilF